MPERRTLWIAAWGLFTAVLLHVALLGMAGEARAAFAGEAAGGPDLGAAAGAMVFAAVFLLARYWRPRPLRAGGTGPAPPRRQALRLAGWGVLVVLMSALLLPTMVLAAEDQSSGWGVKAVLDLWHFAVSLIYAVVAIAVLFGILRYRDKLLGVKFANDVLEKIHSSGMSTAVYYSVWVGAGAYIIGRAFS